MTLVFRYIPTMGVGCMVEHQSLASKLNLKQTGDHYCGLNVRYRSANQANSVFRLFGVDK